MRTNLESSLLNKEETSESIHGKLNNLKKIINVFNGRIEESSDDRVKITIEQARHIKPYDEKGHINGREWAKAIQIINKNISKKSPEDYKAWRSAFYKILSPNWQIRNEISYKDGGSKKWELKDGSNVFLNNNMNSNEKGYLTVTYTDKSKKTFKPNGTEVYNK